MNNFFEETDHYDSAEQHNATATVNTSKDEINEWKQKYVYLVADFENFKKRSTKEYEHMRNEIYSRILKPLLIIIDDFDRALQNQSASSDDGLLLIRKSFDKFLEQCQVTEIEAVGEFDPEKHEALIHIVKEDVSPGHVVEVLQKGYMLHGTVLRPAKVSVAQ